jgi:putative transposase
VPSKSKLKNTAIAERSAALPKIPEELIDQGRMTAEAIQEATMALKNALIERARGRELSHDVGYPLKRTKTTCRRSSGSETD